MAVEMVLVRGSSPLSARLLVNLQDYCEAYIAACDGQGVDVYKRERKLLLDELSGLPGDLHWYNIKKMVSQQCDLMNPLEAELFKLLTDSYGIKDNAPLVLETLNDCFIELLKNSVDALLKHYLEHAGHARLEVVVRLTMDKGRLVVTIIDNAGGFSEGQLKQFNDNVRLKMYDFSTEGVRKQDQKLAYYLGGAGLGVAKLSHALMDGRSEVSPGVFENNHRVIPGTTCIQFENEPVKMVEMEPTLKAKGFVPLGHGAKITLMSPFVSVIPEKNDAPTDSTSFCLDSLLTSSRKRKSEPSSMPIRYQKSIFQPAYRAPLRCSANAITTSGARHPLDSSESGALSDFSPFFSPIL